MSNKMKAGIAMVLLCCTAIMLLFYLGLQNRALKQNIETLEGGWSFALNDTAAPVQPEGVLSSYIFPTVLKGDTATLSRGFSEADGPDRMLAFDTWHCVVRVFIEGEQIYEAGEPYAARGQMLGAVRHIVRLPERFTGKMLTLELVATENNPMPYLTSVAYYEAGEPAILWFNRPLGLLVLGSFFVFLGFAIAFLSCILVTQKRVSLDQMMLGICIVLTGTYILSRGNFIQLLIPDPLLYNAIEYVSLFLLPIPILFYWYRDALRCSHAGVRLGYYICVALNCVFVVVSLLLNFVSAIHLSQLLPVFYFLVLFLAVVIFVLVWFQEKTEDILRKKIYIFGINAFIAGSILSIVAFRLCYNTAVADALKLWSWYNYILPFSMCTLVAFFCMAFALDMKRLLENSFRHEFLQYAAYSDVLTKLFNRRSFQEDAKCLDRVWEERKYGIVSIDLNNLKEVNDTLGHSAGDYMLESFSKLLVAACKNGMKAYRLGGDEFAVVSPDQNVEDCSGFLEKLLVSVADFNREDHGFVLSAACGLATSEEAETVETVFELADRRMYENKKEMKSRTGS